MDELHTVKDTKLYNNNTLHFTAAFKKHLRVETTDSDMGCSGEENI